MACRVGIINYGVAGNLFSIKNCLTTAGAEICIIENENDFNQVDKLVLPGVGSFKAAMENINQNGLINILKDQLSIKSSLGKSLPSKG